MTVASGTRLGPYEVLARLGAGGMGEVWRARDTKLDRPVAIKVLPAAFTEDKDRLARFEREAKLLAQLHHPNVASVFGLEESDGVRALVMELVEGEDLSARIARGPVPLAEALPIARQVAEALEAAHEQGIVHRDLKPANVKVTPDGTVKVLDFGLAKAMDPAGGLSPGGPLASPTLLDSPTVTAPPGTRDGVILGTAAYMAPEQARGKSVDRRADIWAFGVVLWEMLTGRRAFRGEGVSDVLAAVLRDEMDWSSLPAATPVKLRRLLRRCLERDVRRRLRDIGEARIALEEIERGEPEETSAGAAETAGVVVSRRRHALLTAAVAAAALLLGAGAGLLLRPAAEAPGAFARWSLAIPDGLALSTDIFPQLALSNDGRLQVAAVTDSSQTSRLLFRSSDDFEPRLIPDTAGASCPFFSPDGEWIAFFHDRGLYRIPSAGGPRVEIAAVPSATTTRGATWSRDGFIYFTANTTGGLSRVPATGGEVSAVTRLDAAADERTHRWPQALPDGSAVLFTCDTFASTEYYDDARIEAVRPSTGERRVLVEGSSQAGYGGGGHLVFARGGSLYSVDFDPRSLAVRGTREVVAQGVATDVASGAVQFALSQNGSAIWAPGGLSTQYRFYWVDRSGAETPVAVPPAPYSESDLSPDGRRAALVGGAGGAADLWVADLERGTQTRLTVGESVASPVWSPDGARVVYIVRSRGPKDERHWKITWKRADGSRDAEVLADRERNVVPSGFTGDGRQLLFAELRPDGTGSDVWILPVDGREPRLLLGDPFDKRDAVVSPDGRWLAYSSTEGEQPTVFVRPFPSGEGRWQISAPAGFEPRWSRDGRELFYRAGAAIYRVAVDTKEGFSAGRPELLFDRVSSAVTAHTFSPSPDGRRFFTPRPPANRGSLRTIDLDLGFERRLDALAATRGGPR